MLLGVGNTPHTLSTTHSLVNGRVHRCLLLFGSQKERESKNACTAMHMNERQKVSGIIEESIASHQVGKRIIWQAVMCHYHMVSIFGEGSILLSVLPDAKWFSKAGLSALPQLSHVSCFKKFHSTIILILHTSSGRMA